MSFALLATLLGILGSAYVVQKWTDPNLTPIAWNFQDFPIEIRLWEGFSGALPAVEANSNPRAALVEVLERWARVSSLTITLGPDTTQTDAGLDGLSLVTMADTQTNRDLVGQALGVSTHHQLQIFTSNMTGEIVEVRVEETDVVLNPSPPKNWSTVESSAATNFFDVALHELGHSWNLGHPISRSSTMYFQGGGFNFAFNALTWDDISGVNTNYAMVGLDRITGSIAGTVTLNGNPVFGAFLVAVDDEGRLVSNTITVPDGTYTLRFLPPGNYTLYVEPLDGPSTPDAVTQSGGIYSSQSMTTDFLPSFFNGSMTPSVTVNVGATTPGIDFAVSQGNSSLDPEVLGETLNLFGPVSGSGSPAQANESVDTNLIVGGTGVGALQDNQGVFFLSDKLSTGTVAVTDAFSDGTPFKIYPLSVSPDTPQGAYSILLQDGSGEIGVISGGLEVFSRFRFLQAFAQFAHVVGAFTSGVFLINTNLNQAAAGKISGRDRGGARSVVNLGNLSADVNNDLDFSLAAGGTLSVTSSGQSNFVGSLRVGADRAVVGTALFESSDGTTGVGPSRPLYTFVAPIELAGTDINTGFAFTNLDSKDANLYIQVQDRNGNLQLSTVIVVVENGQVARFINEIFPGLPATFEGSALITSNRKIGATVISTRPGIFTTFPAVQNRVFTRTFFAQFAHATAQNLSSQVVLVNPSPQKIANITVQVRKSDGSAASVTLSGELLATGVKVLQIPPLGSVSLKTESDIVGSVEVISSDTPVGGVVLFSSPAVGTAGVGESFPGTGFVLPLARDSSGGIDTGIALVNTTDQIITLTLSVRDSSANLVVEQRQISLLPREQLARFPNQDPLQLQLADNFTGSLWISADGQIAATVIRVSPGVLTTFPVISTAQFITPSD